jgi:hypothetical protein
MESKLYKAFTGSEIEVILLQGELEENNISSLTRDGSTSGVSPYYGGTPLAMDLFIDEQDKVKAEAIIREFILNRDSAEK